MEKGGTYKPAKIKDKSVKFSGGRMLWVIRSSDVYGEPISMNQHLDIKYSFVFIRIAIYDMGINV